MTLTLVLLETRRGTRPPTLHHPQCAFLKRPNTTTTHWTATQTTVTGLALARALQRRRLRKCHCIDTYLKTPPTLREALGL